MHALPSAPPDGHVRRSVLSLVVATALWGFGFVATHHTLESMHPLWSNAVRFVLASAVALVVFNRRLLDLSCARPAALASIFLTAAFAFQTWGLQYTTVQRSSLFTGMYAVITPLIGPLFRAPRPRLLHLVAAGIALAGLTVLAEAWDAALGGLNTGDILTLGCAFMAAAHIHVVGRIAVGRDPFILNAWQILFSTVWSLALALVAGGAMPANATPAAAMGIVYLATFSSLLAFSLQIRAQQTLSPAVAGVLCLMEVPFGVLCGAFFLDETLGLPQLAGGALILSGCVLSVRADRNAPPPNTNGGSVPRRRDE